MVRIYVVRNETGRVVDRIYLTAETVEHYPLPEGFSLEQNDTAQIEEEPIE